MREFLPTLVRNKRLIGLFALMVLLPAFVFSVLIVRAIRTEEIGRAYETIERQRKAVQLAEADLNAWLFSSSAESARSQAVLRFEINADRIDFPDFRLSLSASETARVRPFEPAPASTALTADVIAAQYYPRILAFLRDARTGRHTGAQHFLRLRSLIVAPRGSNHGYVITERDVLECINRKLVELCDRQPFTATAWIPDAQHKTASGGVTYGLQNFPFFEVVFAETGSATTMNVRRHAFAYSMTVLVAITVLGSLFVHRALSHDVRLAHLRNDFVAAVSHEFRSPLSSIVALAERLVSHRSVDGAQLAEYHRIIHHDAQRLSALVTRLLEFGRMEEGKDNYSPAQVDLTVIAQDAINSMGHAVTPGRVRYNGTANAPLWVRADATALCLAIQNLVENAAKYSPADSPIDVTCAAENGWHALEDRDRGMGIPGAEQQRIFEKFYRGRGIVNLNVQGVGIGLALVKRVIERHGGSVSVESSVGEGSRFSLRLPAVES